MKSYLHVLLKTQIDQILFQFMLKVLQKSFLHSANKLFLRMELLELMTLQTTMNNNKRLVKILKVKLMDLQLML